MQCKELNAEFLFNIFIVVVLLNRTYEGRTLHNNVKTQQNEQQKNAEEFQISLRKFLNYNESFKNIRQLYFTNDTYLQ